jgi:hypothetical protein
MSVKPEADIVDESEWYEEAKGMLENFGVSNPTVGEDGSVPVSAGEREVKELNVTRKTSPRREVLNELSSQRGDGLSGGNLRVLGSYGDPVCNSLSCAVIQFLPRTCSYKDTSWEKPDIDVAGIPDQMPSATAYLNPFDASIEGSMEYELQNNSSPGEKIEQQIYKCQENGPKEFIEQEGSEVVDETFDASVIEQRENSTLHNFTKSRDGMEQFSTATVSADFEIEGAIEVIEALYNGWTSGSFNAQAQGSLSVDYNWRGSTNTEEFDVTTTVSVPVTNLNYSW